MNIQDLIEYENENTGLDFKSMHESLLKDVIAMANSDIVGDRFIICGIEYAANGKRNIVGIPEGFIDSAIYQQLINDNIEPSVKVDYFPFDYQGKILGILKLSDCTDQPYMMKKDFGTLKRGDSFIRKGSHQTRLTREDLNRIISSKLATNSFRGNVDCGFFSTKDKVIEVFLKKDVKFPSSIAKEKIQKLIQEKASNSKRIGPYITAVGVPGLASISEEDKSIEMLQEDLESIEKKYEDEDLYYMYDVLSHEMSFYILNKGEQYLEDSSIEVIILKMEGLLVFDRPIRKPHPSNWYITTINGPSYDELNYPNVTENENSYSFISKTGDLKHNIPVVEPDVPVRIFFEDNLVGSTVVMNVLLHGKNLKKPLQFELNMKIIET